MAPPPGIQRNIHVRLGLTAKVALPFELLHLFTAGVGVLAGELHMNQLAGVKIQIDCQPVRQGIHLVQRVTASRASRHDGLCRAVDEGQRPRHAVHVCHIVGRADYPVGIADD